jgi:hypothetical protein
MIEYLNALGTSPFFIGVSVLLLNVGSRYITHELSADDDEYQQNILLRRLAVFAACFMATRDIVTSLLLTAAFVVLAGGVFRGKGPFSREGMENKKDTDIRVASGLGVKIDQPAYNKEEKPMFR